MISPDLEKVLHDSFIGARSAGHRVITIDHLLLRMLDEAPVVEYLKAHSQDVEKLRSELRDCVAHIESGNPEEFDTNPNAAFILLIQKAIARVQVDGTSEVSTLQLFNSRSMSEMPVNPKVLASGPNLSLNRTVFRGRASPPADTAG